MNIPSVQNSPFVITPVSGLLSWTVLAPVINRVVHPTNGDTSSKPSSEQQNCVNEQKELASYSSSMYSKLHLALLESMLEMANKKPLPKYTALICSDEIISIIRRLKMNGELTDTTIADDSLNRLGQALQVSLSQRELHGNISKFGMFAFFRSHFWITVEGMCGLNIKSIKKQQLNLTSNFSLVSRATE